MRWLTTRERVTMKILQLEHQTLKKILHDPQLLLIYIRTFNYESIYKAITDILNRLSQIEKQLDLIVSLDEGVI